MKPVLQREPTGCGIASVATLAGVTYRHAQRAADQFGISVQDDRLWSDTAYVRTLLRHYGIRASDQDRAVSLLGHCRISRFLRSNGAWRVIELFGIGGVLAWAAWRGCVRSQAEPSHTSTYGFWSYEAEVVYRKFQMPRHHTETDALARRPHASRLTDVSALFFIIALTLFFQVTYRLTNHHLQKRRT